MREAAAFAFMMLVLLGIVIVIHPRETGAWFHDFNEGFQTGMGIAQKASE